MPYDNTNRGAIWKNDDKREETHPDFKGSLNVGGVEYWVSAWKRGRNAAEKAPALSFSIKPKDVQPAQAQGRILPGDDRPISQRAMPRGPAPYQREDPISTGKPGASGYLRKEDMDDDIPFSPEWR
jgi:hypothetical protein